MQELFLLDWWVKVGQFVYLMFSFLQKKSIIQILKKNATIIIT